MKFILLLACLALFVAYTHGQRSCRGSVRRGEPNCIGGRNTGTGRRRQCRRNSNDHMWYFSERSRSCRRMSYRGCGGNRNRYCSLEACEQRCVRPTTRPPTRPTPETSSAAPVEPAEPETTAGSEIAATASATASA